MTFLELAEKMLLEEKRPLTANEIWTLASDKGYTKNLNSAGKTPWATLGALIYVNAKDNPRTLFATTETRPKKFYLKSQKEKIDLQAEAQKIPEEELSKKKFDYLEKDLHPYLVSFARHYLHCFTKTIRHNTSKKSEYGDWVHPDLVGCYFPFEDWRKDVFDLSASLGDSSVKFYSFELKRELVLGNLRSSFFQTVSNSSWANESYLVASFISQEEDFRDELSRLSSSFGIGVIHLNIENPHDSRIVFPAKFRETLDWETINKLTMNPDFHEFLIRVKIDVDSRKVHMSEYDPILQLDDIKKSVKN
jgi:hypothetical protein